MLDSALELALDPSVAIRLAVPEVNAVWLQLKKYAIYLIDRRYGDMAHIE